MSAEGLLGLDARESLHRFMHNGWKCQYADIDRCRRLAEFEATLLPLIEAWGREREAGALREAGQDFLARHASWGAVRPTVVRRWMFDRAAALGDRTDGEAGS